jgi:hypothetical protein
VNLRRLEYFHHDCYDYLVSLIFRLNDTIATSKNRARHETCLSEDPSPENLRKKNRAGHDNDFKRSAPRHCNVEDTAAIAVHSAHSELGVQRGMYEMCASHSEV